MIQEFTLKLSPAEANNISFVKTQVAQQANIPASDIHDVKVTKRSIDARGRRIVVQLKVHAAWGDTLSVDSTITPFRSQDVKNSREVIIVGAGPAGLFAALSLIENGIKPVIIERGKDVSRRKRDIATLNQTGNLNEESNYCFGEGGAGTFSDGKIYTRSNKRGDISRVLELFVLHGANPDILIESHPHLGTDKLPSIIENIRKTIIECGGEIHFDSRFTNLILDGKNVVGVKIYPDKTIKADGVILATGHSARDVYQALSRQNVLMKTKPFAMGVRVEHPRELIDSIQYHGIVDSNLPSASYNLVTQVNKRGVYSFCMCPGGIIVPASTAKEEIVVNGMSNSSRNSAFSNSGIAVEISEEDLGKFTQYGSMAGLEYQKQIEHKAWGQSPGSMIAPSQRLTDFLRNKSSQDLPLNSYIPGVCTSQLHDWLPRDISRRLQQGFDDFGKKMRGFITSEAIIVGVESRTSSTIRIPRNPETFEHVEIKNLFVCGEGAGYAGGITSSAMDGITCARKVCGLKEV